MRKMKFFRWAGLSLLLAIVLAAGHFYWLCRRALPTVEGTLVVSGLEQPVEVIRDKSGVPHILASSLDDAIFAQGYVTAQDRLWQMDLLRRTGYGELAEIFGPRALEADKEQRILGFKRLVTKQVRNLPPDDLRLLQHYADGVNAFIEACRDHLPIEFHILRYQPSSWSPADTLVLNLWMGKLLNTSWRTDLMRELVRRKLESKVAAALLAETSPADVLLIGSDNVLFDNGSLKEVASRKELFVLPFGRDKTDENILPSKGDSIRRTADARGMSRPVGISIPSNPPQLAAPATPPRRAFSKELLMPRRDTTPDESARPLLPNGGLQSVGNQPLETHPGSPSAATAPQKGFSEQPKGSTPKLQENETLASLSPTELRLLLAKQPAPSGGELIGSNNWVVAGSRAAGRKPLLANDPHLPHGVPSIWYMTHLQVPGILNVSGVAIPGAPLIILGHNENIAWGVTNLAADVQDLYVETLDPEKPDCYRVNDHWEEMEVYEERIAVRGREPEILKVRSTRHGPVIQDLQGRVLALRWTLLREKISIPIRPELNAARDWEEFSRALENYSGPVQNWVYADRWGNIGFLNAGNIPIRAGGDGSVPVPGETDAYEWTGEIPFTELPRLLNPPSGIIVTANNRIVGKNYRYFLTHNWVSPHRARRIHKLLEARSNLNAADMLRIQGDVYSGIHQPIRQSILQAIDRAMSMDAGPPNQDWRAIEKVLEHYDYQATADSVGTTICERFREVFLEEVLLDKLGQDWKFYQWANRGTVVENLLKSQDPGFLPKAFSSYEGFILHCLQRASQQLADRFDSKQPQSWVWGYYSPIEFKHPLAAFWPLTRLLNTGPYPQPGAPLTIKQTTPGHGVSMRLVVDFSDLDQSFNNITLGQSGQLFSQHYRDQFHHWLSVKSLPMLFTLSKIRQQAASTLHLMPLATE